MAQPHVFLFTLSLLLLLSLVTSEMAKREAHQCEDPLAGTCKQTCDENCKMSCPSINKPCEQLCEYGPCDMKCATKDSCLQEQWCEMYAPQTCGVVRCTSTNCTQKCDDGACNLTCRVRSQCRQDCIGGSCRAFCKAKERCVQNCVDGRCPMRCVSHQCQQSCQVGACSLKCRTGKDCDQQCSSDCPLVSCHSKEGSCKQLGNGGKKMIIRAKTVGYQECRSGNCQQKCTTDIRCYQNCGGSCNQECNSGKSCEQYCAIDGNCDQTCSSNKCLQRCGQGRNCKMTCGATLQCEQRCPQGGCQGVCNSPSCFQLCDSGNCSFECKGPHCHQNCSGGGCTLSCPVGAKSCVQHCPAQNCNITRKEDGHFMVKNTSDDYGIHFNGIETKTNSGSVWLPCSLNFRNVFAFYAVWIVSTYILT